MITTTKEQPTPASTLPSTAHTLINLCSIAVFWSGKSRFVSVEVVKRISRILLAVPFCFTSCVGVSHALG